MQDNIVSVILPINRLENLKIDLIDALKNQTFKSFELIIVDSSSHGLLKEKIKEKINFEGLRDIKWILSKNAFPGKARNAGIYASSCEIIAFIDSMTIPTPNWLQDGVSMLESNEVEYIFGNCKGIYQDYFTRIVRALTYGAMSFSSLPGSIIKAKALSKIGIQIEYARAGEDIEWIQRVKYLGIKSKQPDDITINYYGFPKNIFQLSRKWFEYSIENAKLNILTFQKVIYFYLLLAGFLYFVYSWNYIFTYGQWDQSSAFIPNLNTFFWGALFGIYFFMRSIYLPLKRKERLKFIFPINWILIGLIGIIIDLAKVPGRVYGLLRIIIFKD